LALWVYRHVPPFRALADVAYRFVAIHRPFADRMTSLLWGDHVVPPGERFTTWLLARMFGIVALAVFASLEVQMVGLVGRNGILPAADLLARAHERYGALGAYQLPTLFWIHPADVTLHLMCGAGMAASLALTLGLIPGASALAIAALYLS